MPLFYKWAIDICTYVRLFALLSLSSRDKANIQINPRNLFHHFPCLCSLVERLAKESGWVWGASVFGHYSVSSKTTNLELILYSDSGIVSNSVYHITSLKKPAWRYADRYGWHIVPESFQFLRPLPSFLRTHVSIKQELSVSIFWWVFKKYNRKCWRVSWRLNNSITHKCVTGYNLIAF